MKSNGEKMNRLFRVLLVIATATLIFAGCSGNLPEMNSNDSADSLEKESNSNASTRQELTGLIEQIEGDRWVVAGSTVFVNPAVLGGVKYTAGDKVNLEGVVNSDGSITAVSVLLLELGNTNTNDNTNNANASNMNNSNTNTNTNSNGNTNANININSNINSNANSNSNSNDD